MDERITAKMDELTDLCTDLDVSLVLSVTDSKYSNETSFGGSSGELAMNFLVIKDTLSEIMDKRDCDCPGCNNFRKELGVKKNQSTPKRKQPHIHVVDMMGEDADIMSILENIFGGGQSDND